LADRGGTPSRRIAKWWARKRGKEDPTTKIGEVSAATVNLYGAYGVDLTIYQGEGVGIIGHNGPEKYAQKLLSRVTAPTRAK
jgi:lipopolysaccharide transport system ATP-binding protein